MVWNDQSKLAHDAILSISERFNVRYWEARGQIQSMSSKWGDAVAQLIQFETQFLESAIKEKPSWFKNEGVMRPRTPFEYQRSVVLYMTALHGLAIQALR